MSMGVCPACGVEHMKGEVMRVLNVGDGGMTVSRCCGGVYDGQPVPSATMVVAWNPDTGEAMVTGTARAW